MRRAGLGEGAAASNYGYTNSGYSVYEEENEKLTESLRSKVTAIKSLSIEIGAEVKQQNKLLSEMIFLATFVGAQKTNAKEEQQEDKLALGIGVPLSIIGRFLGWQESGSNVLNNADIIPLSVPQPMQA
ncbi:hypothetical protein JRQ81_018615 [Phrynocephalus forsythii]|uniref:t-SNARE coiled-coil homology domain-containing protein n=1 Tax=Phrynocephalus forsythii TaxID=171643 RepID=A0A9Q0XNV8_9SAUR|nr:hypothetical protein JRQ81_018615 [Phrynocephalus forsythii]